MQAIYFEYPFQKVDDVTVQLPLGWLVSSTPAAQKQDAHVVGYTLDVDHDAGALHWKRTLNVDLVLLESKYYGALRNFFQVVRTSDDSTNHFATGYGYDQRVEFVFFLRLP